MNSQGIDPHTVRQSPIAGTWYPGSPRELEKTVDDLLGRASYYATEGELLGLISPHAGYQFSGQTAAYAYRQLEHRQRDLVVLLGPSHYEDYGPFAVSAKAYFATPLGLVPLDEDFIERLAQKVDLARVEQDREHSLEIQLPFLQRSLKGFSLVPIMVSLPFYILGSDALAPCKEMAAALADLAYGRKVVFVASSDLSHLTDYRAVEKNDARLAELLEAFDIGALAQYMWQDRECRACGDAPIVISLLAAKKLGADRAHVIYRTHSGDVTGARVRGQYTVGYMAAGIYRPA